MKLRTTTTGLIAEDEARGRWVQVPYDGNLLSFLAGGAETAARAEAAFADAATADPGDAVLPFRPPLPSNPNEAASIAHRASWKLRLAWPLATVQTRTVLSAPAEARRSPVGSKTRPGMWPRWPANDCTSRPVAASHKRMRPALPLPPVSAAR